MKISVTRDNAAVLPKDEMFLKHLYANKAHFTEDNEVELTGLSVDENLELARLFKVENYHVALLIY